MTINKFQGKTKEEAIAKAREEFGSGAVIMNVKEIKPKGLFRAFKNPTYEVTAAMEEKESFASQLHHTVKETEQKHESIDLAADEQIVLPKQEKKPAFTPQPHAKVRKEKDEGEEKELEQKLEDLSDRLEKTLGVSRKEEKNCDETISEQLKFVRILYSTMVKNEVNEKYVNQILDEVEEFIRPGSSVDTILANVYQKLILRFGQSKTIEMTGKRPNVVFFVGPTGVGKTTTIAKISSNYKVEFGRKVAFITTDTYRIAATEQLNVYANILDAPMEIVYSKEDINSTIDKFKDYDLVFVDTAGFSHKNQAQRADIRQLLEEVDPKYHTETYLVLSATTKYRDLLEIVDIYHEIADYKLIFTKLDETTAYGNLLNIKLYSGAAISYTTYGQNVPDDIEVFDTQKIVKQLLGGNY